MQYRWSVGVGQPSPSETWPRCEPHRAAYFGPRHAGRRVGHEFHGFRVMLFRQRGRARAGAPMNYVVMQGTDAEASHGG